MHKINSKSVFKKTEYKQALKYCFETIIGEWKSGRLKQPNKVFKKSMVLGNFGNFE